jgi:hypothetical protein
MAKPVLAEPLSLTLMPMGFWAALYFPVGALGKAYALGGYPFDWNQTIESSFIAVNEWLKGIAEAVYKDF